MKGCLEYAGSQSWAVHAYEPSATGTVADSTWALVGATTNDLKMVKLPGTVGFSTYATFADCVTANKALPPVEYEHCRHRVLPLSARGAQSRPRRRAAFFHRILLRISRRSSVASSTFETLIAG